ncbi:MAG: hypothetical protein WDN28_18705 [Chthoniobacter sp.]
MLYYEGRWNENRGDEFASWGGSDWYFEVQPDGIVVRQMEVYDSGSVLQYDAEHLEDHYGMLADQPFDAETFPGSAITREEFEHAWSTNSPTNRQ